MQRRGASPKSLFRLVCVRFVLRQSVCGRGMSDSLARRLGALVRQMGVAEAPAPHAEVTAVGLRPPRTLHTGTETTKPPLPLERKRQLRLDTREKR